MTGAELNQLFKRPISDIARGFLRALRFNHRHCERGAPLKVENSHLAFELKSVGDARFLPDAQAVEITGLGQAYLDALMRAH